jgi:uncharacterized protein
LFQIQNHRKLLTYEGLAPQCQKCLVVDVCGGGSIPHRYAEDGFTHPTVYCYEMLTLINHAKERFQHQLNIEIANQMAVVSISQEINFDIQIFEQPETSLPLIKVFLEKWRDNANQQLKSALEWPLKEGFVQLEVIEQILSSINNSHISIYPSVVMWTSVVRCKMYLADQELIINL